QPIAVGVADRPPRRRRGDGLGRGHGREHGAGPQRRRHGSGSRGRGRRRGRRGFQHLLHRAPPRVGRPGGAARGAADRRLLPQPGRPRHPCERERCRRHPPREEPRERARASRVPHQRGGPGGLRRGEPGVPRAPRRALVPHAAELGHVPAGHAGPDRARRAQRRCGPDLRPRGMEVALRRNWRLAVRSLPWGWSTAALVLAGLLAVPVVTIPIGALSSAGDAWSHVAETLLPRYLGNTLILVAASGTIALTVGAGTAWLVAMCEFPGRRFFRWALVLPLAVPAYMAAYVYAGIFGVTGPLQRIFRMVVPGSGDAFL